MGREARRGQAAFRSARAAWRQDLSHPAIAVNLDACIQCTRCVRACRDEQVNDVIGLAFRGEHAKIVFDMDDPMGALHLRGLRRVRAGLPDRRPDAGARSGARPCPTSRSNRVCPYCGVGCQLTYNVKDNKILYVEGRDGPANHGRLCVKGRYGFDYAHHPQRLTKPLIRRADAPKRGDFDMDPDRVMDVFREASWEEALDFAGGKLRRHPRPATARSRWPASARPRAATKRPTCSRSWCAPASAATTSTTARACATPRRWWRCSKASARARCRNPVMDVTKAEVVVIIGANPTVNHPVAATWIKNAVKNGTKLIVMDPRRSDLARLAHRFLQFKPDTDVAMLNAMMNVIVTEGLVDEDFIASRTIGYEELRKNVEGYTPEADGADLRHRRRDPARRGAAVRHVARPR